MDLIAILIATSAMVVCYYLFRWIMSYHGIQVHNAVIGDNYEKVSHLIDTGKDINAISPRHGERGGWTPLHQAKSAAIANLLIDSGADVNALSDHGWTPLYHMCKTTTGSNPELDVIEALLENGARRGISREEDDPIIIESALKAFGKSDLMEKLIENESVGLGRTALHIAAGLGDAKKVMHYINRGDDVNARDAEGITPLFMALLENKVDVAKILLKQDIDVNIPDKDGTVPLSAAAGVGDRSLVRAMIYKGSNVNYQENDGWSPLHYACHLGHSAIVKILLENGADPSLTDINGLRPMDYAADQGFSEIEAMFADKP